MATYKLIWAGPKPTLEDADILLSEIMHPPADAVSLTKDDPVKEDPDTGWHLAAYFSELPEVKGIQAFLKEHNITLPSPKVEELPEQDWVAHALEGLGIIEAGRFVLYGIHDADKVEQRDNIIPIRIDANQAFGTGHHPTTAGCLKVLDTLTSLEPENVLDLGAGSACLAIAAAKIWNSKILATDIDPPSVKIAADNVQYNNVSKIDCIEADGFDHAEIQARAPYDFIFANILAGPLKELSPGMAKIAAPGATIILAGLLAEQESGVIEAYEKAGFHLQERLAQKTWPILVMKKT